MNALERLRLRFPVLIPPSTKLEARLEIARELLDVLRIGRMRPAFGYGYFDLSRSRSAKGVTDTYEGVALAMKIPGKTTCTVCAIGAACLVAVGLYDDHDALEKEYGQDGGDVDADTMRDVLAKWFTRRQLDIIECAYEVSIQYGKGGSSGRARARAVDFGERYQYPRLRLEAIMENIVQNNGTFKP